MKSCLILNEMCFVSSIFDAISQLDYNLVCFELNEVRMQVEMIVFVFI